MLETRGSLAVETLLKIVLGLLAILLALRIVSVVLGAIVGFLFELLMPVLVLAAMVLIGLWLLDER